jgi:hypothetical protein
MNQAIKCAFTLLKPSFYTSKLNNAYANIKTDIQKGSPQPLFKLIAFVCVTGYCVEYVAVGSKFDALKN